MKVSWEKVASEREWTEALGTQGLDIAGLLSQGPVSQ